LIRKRFLDELGVSIPTRELKKRHYMINKNTKSRKESKLNFSMDDDKRLVALTLEVGLKWDVIAGILGVEDSVKIKNRYYNYIKREGRFESIMEALETKT